MGTSRPATVEDLHALAQAMPHTTVEAGPSGNEVYQVGRRSFVYFRTPRPDAVDPVTGERYADVVVIWVPDETDKAALIAQPGSPFFSTPHFDGHPSVLLRTSRLGELTLAQLGEVVEDAWLSRASARRAAQWRGQSARSGNQKPISRAADSGESDPCTRFSRLDRE